MEIQFPQAFIRTGSRFSLSVHLDSSLSGGNGGGAGFVSPLCPGAFVNLAGRSVLAKIFVAGPALPHDGQSRFMVAKAFNGSFWVASNEIPVDTYNQWVPVQFTFFSDATNVVSLTINTNVYPDVGHPAWVGNVQLDDVVIQ